MTITLMQRQRRFVEDILSRDPEKGCREIPCPPPHLMEVYRYTIIQSLLNALKLTYPKVLNIIGEDQFDKIAQPFCIKYPPEKGYLDSWGGEFYKYLTRPFISDEFPFLPDLAQFEYLKNQKFLLPEPNTLGLEMLHDIQELENWAVMFNPTVFLLESAYDLKRILDYADGDIPSLDPPFDKPTYMLSIRQQDKVQIYWLEAEICKFIKNLKGGKSALEAFKAVPNVNLAETLVFAFSNKLFTSILEM